MPTEVIIHEPTHEATIRVIVRRKLQGDERGPVLAFTVVCYTTMDKPPILVMPTRQHVPHALKLHPGERVEVAGIAELQTNCEIFHAPVAWLLVGIEPSTVPLECFEIEAVFVDGHKLGGVLGTA